MPAVQAWTQHPRVAVLIHAVDHMYAAGRGFRHPDRPSARAAPRRNPLASPPLPEGPTLGDPTTALVATVVADVKAVLSRIIVHDLGALEARHLDFLYFSMVT